MSLMELKKQSQPVEHFYAHAIVDRHNQPLHDVTNKDMSEQDLKTIVQIYNDTAGLNGDEKAPYRVVPLFFRD